MRCQRPPCRYALTRWLRGGCFLAPVFSSPPSLPRLSLSYLPTASLLPLYHGSWPQCAAPLCAQSETRTAAGRDARQLGKDRCITTGSEGPCTPSAPPHPSCTLPAHSCLHPSAPVCIRLHPSPTPAHPGTPCAPSSPSLRTLTRTLTLTLSLTLTLALARWTSCGPTTSCALGLGLG